MSENSYTFIVHWPDEEPEEEQTEYLEDELTEEEEEASEVPLVPLVSQAKLNEGNQSAQYWRLECPEVLTTAKNRFRYFPKSGKLKAGLPDFYSKRRAEFSEGKSVGIDLASLKAAPATLSRLIQILLELRDE